MFLFNSLKNGLFYKNAELIRVNNGNFSYYENEEWKLILNEASISIKKFQEFNYELIVQDKNDNLDEEASFLIDKVLEFKVSNKSLIWVDTENPKCLWKFEAAEDVDQFQEIMVSCMFEREYQKKYTDASDNELQSFIAALEAEVLASDSTEESDIGPTQQVVRTPNVSPDRKPKIPQSSPDAIRKLFKENLVSPQGTQVLLLDADLGYFDVGTGMFIKFMSNIKLEVLSSSNYDYYLVISSETPLVVQRIYGKMNPYTNSSDNTFIWNECDENELPKVSWCLFFHSDDDFHSFTAIYFSSLFESVNRTKYSELKPSDVEYISEAFQDEMEIEEEEEEDEDEDEEEVFKEKDHAEMSVDDDPSTKNSLLSVGYKHNRSFVVRGNKIGVFKHTEDNELKFATTINNIGTKNGDYFSPRKMMLHNQDSQMIMMKPGDEHNLHVMDLEYGKVVDEWHIDDYRKVNEIIPDQKYAQQTTQQTLLGINDKAMFRIDSRLAGDKIADGSVYQYKSKVGLSCAATTGQGHVAVGSSKGEIRLFDKVGKAAKTLLPGLGDPIIGMDTTENGKYVLATCSNYLMVIDTEPGDGAVSAFNRSHKAKPKRLTLKPEHVAWMGKNVNFTPAKFNTGSDLEKTIVTSTGPFVITWNFRRVKNGHLYDYSIKQYTEDVIADNFKFGEDRNIIVALGGNVEMTAKSQLQTPTKLLKSRHSIVNSPY